MLPPRWSSAPTACWTTLKVIRIAEEQYAALLAVSAQLAKAVKMMATATLAYVQIQSVHLVLMESKMGLRQVLTVVVLPARAAQTEVGVLSAATVRQAVASQKLRCQDQVCVLQVFPRERQHRRWPWYPRRNFH